MTTKKIKNFKWFSQLLSVMGLLSIGVGCFTSNGVFFKNLKNEQEVKSPIQVDFGVKGMKVVPAGPLTENTGHHHLIINGGYMEKEQVIPMDAKHLHFGKGQTDTSLELEPGEYQLTLQFADGVHRSYGKDWSKTIKIRVVE